MGKVTYKKGLCGICPAGCWVEVGIEGGKLVEIKPDKSHPLGMLCKRGEHAPEIIYSKDRIETPLKRKGPKGSFEFEPISWDEAYNIIVEKLNKIKKESSPEAVSIYTGRGAFELSLCDIFQPKEAPVSSASNILFRFGSPNTMGVGALCYVSYAIIAPDVTMGRMLINMFADIENAELLIVWGTNPATDSPPLDMHRLENAAKRGAKIIVIDPRRTETALRTNAEWIPIRSGSDGALALGLLNVMLEEEFYEVNFAENWTLGFKEFKEYVQHFTPEVVEQITGVTASRIKSLAREIFDAKGACPVIYTGLEYSNSGIQAIRAIFTLFALAGQLDVPGGIGLAMLNSHFPINRSCNQPNPNIKRAVARNKFPLYSYYRGESHASGLVNSVLKGEPYKIRGLIIHGGSILTSWPQTDIWRKTLAKLDFLVTIDRQLTADAAYADVVLPATTMFEINSYMTYGPIFRLREKLIEPVGQARNDYLIMVELANRLGYGEIYPQTEEELIRFVLKGSGYTLEDVKKAGGWVKIPTPVMEYKKWEKGKLRVDGKPGFNTPTGKFEIWSTTLEKYGYEPLPKYVEVKEGPLGNPLLAKKFPLVFNSGARPQTDFRSQHHNIKSLLKESPEPFVEMNIENAKERGIKSGDLVEVRTPRGAVKFRAKVTNNIMKGNVDCSMGGGTPVGPKPWRERNVNQLTDLNNFDEISGFPVYKALLCEVVKVQNTTGKKNLFKEINVINNNKFNLKPRPIKKLEIYLDNNATTKVDPLVKEAILPFLTNNYGNPSSIHSFGRKAADAIKTAKRNLARLLNTFPNRIIFTSGGSESDNLALKGIAFNYASRGKHIITSQIEHPAILNACKFLEKIGFEVTYLPVDENGMVQPSTLEKLLRKDTILVSIMMANNEVGTIQPIKELCEITHDAGALFHTDAVQAVSKIDVDVEELGVDLLSLSGHKFHAPKGIGALYIKKSIRLEPLIHGGKQEYGFRGGTHNTPSIVGLGKAAELAIERLNKMEKVKNLRNKLHNGIIEIIPEAKLNGHQSERLPNTLNLTFPGYRGESIVIAMDQHGIALSSGSACKSGSPLPTHVLLAMGRSKEEAHCALRFSLSDYTTNKEIDITLKTLKKVIKEMENTVRFLACK